MWFTGQFGDTLPREPSAAALEALLDKRRNSDPERFADVSVSALKMLNRGEYVLERPGEAPHRHFGSP
jgi:exoribonuclease-2